VDAMFLALTQMQMARMLDCQEPEDSCPNHPNKYDAGYCGCGVADTNSDSNGTPNCLDECPNDMTKIVPGACGCSTLDKDTDEDGMPDCKDSCSEDSLKTEPGACGCGNAETDTDDNMTAD